MQVPILVLILLQSTTIKASTRTCTVITDDISDLVVEPLDFLSRQNPPAGVDLPAGTEIWLQAISASNQPRYTATTSFWLDYFSDVTAEFAAQISNSASFVVALQLDDALYERSISEQELAECVANFRNLTREYPGVSTGQHELKLVFQSKSFAGEWLIVPSVHVTACYDESPSSAVYWGPIVGVVLLAAVIVGCLRLKYHSSEFAQTPI